MIGAALMAAGASTASTLLNGLLGYWELNGNGNDALGRVNVSPFVPPAVYQDNAFHAGSNEFMVTPTNTAQTYLRPTNAFSASCWVKFLSAATAVRVFSDFDNNASSTRWILGYGGTSGLSVVVYSATPSAGDGIALLSNSVSINVEHHLAVTSDGSVVRAYFDGAPAGTVNKGHLSTGNPSNPISFGRQFNVASNINALLRRCGIWDRALTQAEITELYNGGAGKTYPFS